MEPQENLMYQIHLFRKYEMEPHSVMNFESRGTCWKIIDIEDEGVRLLSELTSLINLKEMNLADNNICIQGLKYLKRLNLPELTKLDLSFLKIMQVKTQLQTKELCI